MFRYVCVILAILASYLAAGGEPEDTSKLIQARMLETNNACLKEFGLTEEYLKGLKHSDFGKLDPCFVACRMKGLGMIDDKGMFDFDESYALVSKFVESPDELAKIKKVGENCKSVNDEKVTDGNKGCERSILLLKCFQENKAERKM